MGRNLYFSLHQVLWRKCHILRQIRVKQHPELSRYLSDFNLTDPYISERRDVEKLDTNLPKDVNGGNDNATSLSEFSLDKTKSSAQSVQPMHEDGRVQRITRPTMFEPSAKHDRRRRPRIEEDQFQEKLSNRSEKLDTIQTRLQNLSTMSTEQTLSGIGKREKVFQNVGKTEKIDQQPLPIVLGEMLFGLHPVSLAIKHGKRKIHSLYVKEEARGTNSVHKGDNYIKVEEITELAKTRNIPIKMLTRSQLDVCSNNRPHQGVCLDVSPIKPCIYSSEEMDNSLISHTQDNTRLPLWLLLYQVQDPMNFGAILRSAYMFGVNRVMKTNINSCSLTPVVSKASAGTMEIMDIYTISEDLEQFINNHQEAGWSVLGTDSANNNNNTGSVVEEIPCTNGVHEKKQESSDRKPTPIQDYSMDKPAILIIGNEGVGLPQSVLSCCDEVVCAEVASDTSYQHSVDSLNVSVATGILLHSLMLKRRR